MLIHAAIGFACKQWMYCRKTSVRKLVLQLRKSEMTHQIGVMLTLTKALIRFMWRRINSKHGFMEDCLCLSDISSDDARKAEENNFWLGGPRSLTGCLQMQNTYPLPGITDKVPLSKAVSPCCSNDFAQLPIKQDCSRTEILGANICHYVNVTQKHDHKYKRVVSKVQIWAGRDCEHVIHLNAQRSSNKRWIIQVCVVLHMSRSCINLAWEMTTGAFCSVYTPRLSHGIIY